MFGPPRRCTVAKREKSVAVLAAEQFARQRAGAIMSGVAELEDRLAEIADLHARRDVAIASGAKILEGLADIGLEAGALAGFLTVDVDELAVFLAATSDRSRPKRQARATATAR